VVPCSSPVGCGTLWRSISNYSARPRISAFNGPRPNSHGIGQGNMPGILGLGSKSPARDAAALLEEMASRLKHYSSYVEHLHVEGAAGVALGRMTLGFGNATAQPAGNNDRSVLVVMDGELYDYDEQRRSLVPAGRGPRG